MIVELAGLPGSGKTTLVRGLVATRPDLRSTIVRPGWGSLLTRRGLALHPFNLARAVGPDRGWPAWPALVARALAQAAIRPAPGATILLEEGIVHHVWRTLYLHPGLEDAGWDRLLDQQGPLVVLAVSRGTRAARVAAKPGPGPVNRELATQAGAWARGEALFNRVLEAAGRGRPIHRVATEGSASEAATRLAGLLADLESS